MCCRQVADTLFTIIEQIEHAQAPVCILLVERTRFRPGRWMSHSVKKKAPRPAAPQPMMAPLLSAFSNCGRSRRIQQPVSTTALRS